MQKEGLIESEHSSLGGAFIVKGHTRVGAVIYAAAYGQRWRQTAIPICVWF
jgi:hypothetical protein